ncbi:MAG: SUMF1/EgtB/PvdO family nonheme iron enzyme [Planctomycetes bacterium]|nr:SUMF1/EgtB/PvdO family nonheme iron enzyme [Planctomycetota bacterium]
MGNVSLGYDYFLQRDVALKYASFWQDPDSIHLWREGRIACQLQHPNIPSIHDWAQDESRRPFLVMQRVDGRTLEEILRTESWSLERKLIVIQQLAATLEFAHRKRVLHLDLKPSNVMIGAFGELYLLDWGVSERVPDGAETTQLGGVGGTTRYMSPEQARASSGLTPASDVFSLGVVLYEAITGVSAFPGSETEARLRVVSADFDRSQEWLRIPEGLQTICTRILRIHPEERPTLPEVRSSIDDYLEGSREIRRRRKAARASLDRARSALDQVKHNRELVSTFGDRSLEEEVRALGPVADDEWSRRDALDQLEARAVEARSAALLALREGRQLDPESPEIALRLSELYVEELHEADRKDDRLRQRYLARELGSLGLAENERLWKGVGGLELRSNPPAERAVVSALAERERKLVPVEPRELRATPFRWTDLPIGPYQVELRHPAYPPLVTSVRIQRGQTIQLDLTFRTPEETGTGFVHVPPGPAIVGGDPTALESLDFAETWVEEYAIGRFSVTIEEYFDFLRHVESQDPQAALRLAPRKLTGEPLDVVCSDPIDPVGHPIHYVGCGPSHPVVNVSWSDAMAYAEWFGAQNERPGAYTLPTDLEWEKAARGGDGRVYPWGQRFEPTFCQTAASNRGDSKEPEIGRYPADESVYGVRDMAGCVKDWCLDWFVEEYGQRVARGGCWNQPGNRSRSAYRMGLEESGVRHYLGFRLVHHFSYRRR